MDDLIAFLRARLDEDEQVAHAIDGGEWDYYEDNDGSRGHVSNYHMCFLIEGIRLTKHIARHDPARVLREVEAKRRIIDIHRPIVDGGRDPAWPAPGHCVECTSPMHDDYQPYPCQSVRLLALPYAEHPDYRPQWTP